MNIVLGIAVILVVFLFGMIALAINDESNPKYPCKGENTFPDDY